MAFETEWLDLREPADAAARNGELRDAAIAFLAATPDPVVVDLGAGTGSTMRALSALRARWRLIDNDTVLLGEARARCGDDVETVEHDLDDVETVEHDLTDIENLPLHDARLVTASALFDLAGPEWIDALAGRLAKAGVGLYAALSYDGVLEWQPADVDDLAARDAFNLHQRGDKGFGRALGPFAAAYLADAMRKRGYAVSVASSSWTLGPDRKALQDALVKGIAIAASEAGMHGAHDWRDRRFAQSGRATCVVGHLDVLALPRSQSKMISVDNP